MRGDLAQQDWAQQDLAQQVWAQQDLGTKGNRPPHHLHGGRLVIYPEGEASHNHKIATLDVTISGMAHSLSRRLWRLAAVDMGNAKQEREHHPARL
jgi:hypothetical protein